MSSQLAKSANDAIDYATKDKTYVSGDDEPSLVARLVASLPKLLVDNWSKHYAAGELHVTSTFCHHMPQAHWDSLHGLGPGRSELCDLLLLVSSPDASGELTEHALLIQAKQGSQGQTKLTGKGDHKQRYMYTEWPNFHIASGPCKHRASNCKYATQIFNIKTAASDGTRYGVVAENEVPSWHLESQFQTWSPAVKQGRLGISNFSDVGTESISAQLSLGEAMVKMVNKSLGHPVSYNKASDWEHVVGILMINAMEAQFKQKLTSVKHTPGAPLVPLSAACSLFTTHIPQNPPPLFIRSGMLLDYDRDVESKSSSGNAGGVIYSSPPGERVRENVEGGYGIISIIVNGRFAEDDVRDPAPDGHLKT